MEGTRIEASQERTEEARMRKTGCTCATRCRKCCYNYRPDKPKKRLSVRPIEVVCARCGETFPVEAMGKVPLYCRPCWAANGDEDAEAIEYRLEALDLDDLRPASSFGHASKSFLLPGGCSRYVL